jgi:hypothetical protein
VSTRRRSIIKILDDVEQKTSPPSQGAGLDPAYFLELMKPREERDSKIQECFDEIYTKDRSSQKEYSPLDEQGKTAVDICKLVCPSLRFDC